MKHLIYSLIIDSSLLSFSLGNSSKFFSLRISFTHFIHASLFTYRFFSLSFNLLRVERHAGKGEARRSVKDRLPCVELNAIKTPWAALCVYVISRLYNYSLVSTGPTKLVLLHARKKYTLFFFSSFWHKFDRIGRGWLRVFNATYFNRINTFFLYVSNHVCDLFLCANKT